MEKKQFAFWMHGEVPYVLCGAIKSISELGLIRVEGYDYPVYRTLKILPYEEGLKLAGKIKKIGEKYREREESLRFECLKEINELMDCEELSTYANKIYTGSDFKLLYRWTDTKQSIYLEKQRWTIVELNEIKDEKNYLFSPMFGVMAIKEVY